MSSKTAPCITCHVCKDGDLRDILQRIFSSSWNSLGFHLPAGTGSRGGGRNSSMCLGPCGREISRLEMKYATNPFDRKAMSRLDTKDASLPWENTPHSLPCTWKKHSLHNPHQCRCRTILRGTITRSVFPQVATMALFIYQVVRFDLLSVRAMLLSLLLWG